MKQSLRKAIALFNLPEQLYIYFGLICFKLKRKVPVKAAMLLASCNNYVRIIEQGASITKEDNNLIKTSVVINEQTVTVFLRKNSSDLQVFESVIQHEEYKIVTEKVKVGNVIVDAGGNIGLTTVYLHAFYPQANFIVIEPDDSNFSLLKINLKQNNINRAKLFNKALWVNNEQLVINHSFRDGKDWSLTVEKANGAAAEKGSDFLEGISLQDICFSDSIETIDLLKIDIEGAERFLFVNDSFLQTVNKHTKNLVIEIHDEFNIRGPINAAMQQIGFTKRDAGDITLYSRQ